MKMTIIDWIAFVLVMIGDLNWGFVGLFNFNLVTALFDNPIIIKIVYILIGLSVFYTIGRAMLLMKKKK